MRLIFSIDDDLSPPTFLDVPQATASDIVPKARTRKMADVHVERSEPAATTIAPAGPRLPFN